MILIGSAPLKIEKGEEVKEYDIVATESEQKLFSDTNLRIDFSPVDLVNNADIEQRFSEGTTIVGGVEVPVCSKRGLAAIKRSHLYRDWFFEKHIGAYHIKLARHRDPKDDDWIAERTRLTQLEYRQPSPSLNKTNEDFFDDAVEKVYDHDYLHEIVAYNDAPMYTLMKRDQSKAWCERDMWEAFSEEQKIQCAAEEVYVIATERFMVPSNWTHSKPSAYYKALKKTCTTLTSGWFRDFYLDNYPKLAYMYDIEKFEDIKERLCG